MLRLFPWFKPLPKPKFEIVPIEPTVDELCQALPDTKRQTLEKYHDSLIQTFQNYDMMSPLRQAAFLSQCAHESANFTATIENLNYSKEALVKTWPKHFPTLKEAEPYHRNPEKIANKAYANRMGNGDEKSGDGWKYRGRGILQITGKFNYQKCGASLGIDLEANPELLETLPYLVLSAGWFWKTNGLNPMADKEDIQAMTRRINGGTNGLADRTKKYEIAKKALVS